MATSKQNPFDYPVVMDVIQSFIHCADTLRSCRRVSKLWLKHCNEKALQKSTFLGLKRLVHPEQESLGFSIFLNPEGQQTNGNIQRIKIADRKELLQHENVLDFFQRQGRQLKYMSFEVAKNEDVCLEHFQFIENVLYKWCPQLQELRLVGLFDKGIGGSGQEEELQSIQLKKLVLEYKGINLDPDALLTPVIEKILKCAKQLDCLVFSGCQFDPYLGNISGEIVRQICDKSNNLTSLEFCNIPIGEEEISLMTRAGWPLKTFIFQGLPERNLRISHLNLFLDTYSVSLKHFHLRVHWITSFNDVGLELGVHTLPNLEVLKIAVRNIKVGISGLLGNLKNLQHLTLWGSSALIGGVRVNIETMFAYGASTSIKTLCLDQAYVDEVSALANCCPAVSKLEIDLPVAKINEFISNLNQMVSTNGGLEDLKVIAHFEALEVHNDDFMKRLIIGLCRLKLRTLKISAVHNMDNLPWMRHAWIEEGIIENEIKYFSFDLNGFCIRDDEVEAIAATITGSANFTTWVGCKVIAMNTGGVLRLRSTTFCPDSVKAQGRDIVKAAREKEKINAKINQDVKNVKIW